VISKSWRSDFKLFLNLFKVSLRQWKLKRSEAEPLWRVKMLIIENPKYVKLAKVSVLTFLYFNEQAHVNLYVDSNTIKRVEKKFSHLKKLGKLTIVNIEGRYSSWQEAKVGIISNSEIPDSVYIDSDLRFNGKLTRFSETTVFFNEGNLNLKSSYLDIFTSLGIDTQKKEVKMYNSSIVYITKNDEKRLGLSVSHFKNFEKKLAFALRISEVSPNERLGIWRVREQLYISVSLSQNDVEVKSLKDSDARLDGSIVESVYYGATGLGY
jgi:hypothetical protein